MTPATTLGIRLVPGVRPANLWSYLLVAAISSAYASGLAVLQPGLLHALDISPGDQALLTGGLAALQELVFLALLGPIGALADRVGRRRVYALGLLLAGVGYTLYGQSGSVAELLIWRVVVAVGCAAVVGMMVTVIADYPEEADRGKANGLQGLVATLGAFIPPLLLPLPALFIQFGFGELAAQQAAWAAGGALGVFAAAVAATGLSAQVGRVARETPVPLRHTLREAAASARNPAIALAFAAAFTSRGVLAVTGAFMSLWLVQHGTGNLGLSASEAMNSLAMPRVLTIVSGALVGALLMGLISDRLDRVTAVALAAGLTALVYGALFWVTDPSAAWVYPLLAMMGVAEIGAFISSQALIGQQAPPALRGAVIGFFGMAGALGILVGTSLGGLLFRSFSPSSPFVMFALFNLAVCAWALRLRRSRSRSAHV